MGELTKIQWAHHTFNPWWGCRKVPRDPACAHCYAEATAKRWGLDIWGPNKPRKFMSEANWKKPLRWDRLAAKAGERHRVFCASMADVFEDRDDLYPVRERLWRLIEQTPNLDWLLLTKRPESLDWLDVSSRANVWLGITAATQQHYDERWPLLARHPAAVHFISCEPMMESIDFMLDLKTMDGPRPEWIILGGESGPKARPCAQEWLEHAVKWCRKGKVPVFVKQLGAHSTRGGERRRFSDSHAGDPSEWPSKLRVRQLPKGVRA